MRKAIALAVIVAFLASLPGCFGPSTHVSRFRITDVRFRWIAGTPTGVSACAVREAVRGEFVITYVPADATAVTFSYALGQHTASQSTRQVEWYDAGSDPDLDGRYVFNTMFTALTWVTIRGTATTPQGSVVVNHRIVNIDNVPPGVSVDPRDKSVLNQPPAAIVVNVVDSGGTEGADEEGTEVAVTIDGMPLDCMRTNGENQIRFVPSSWPDGTYVVTVVPKDMTGNVGQTVTATFTLDRSIQGSPPLISITSPPNGSPISGCVDLVYSKSDDVVAIWVDVAYGHAEPLVWWQYGGDESDVSGHFPFETLGLGANPISVRLFAKSMNGLTSLSEPRIFQVQ